MENNVSQDAKKTGICVGFSFVTCLVILSLVGFAVLGLFFNGANAQMQYEVHGTIMSTATNYHLIYDVRAGDLLVIGVNPTENGKYFSAVFSPNLTRIGYTGSVNLYSENVPVGGTHSYQFIANATGNYVLRIWTTSSAFNYTTKVSHKVSTGDPPQATPYNTPGEINATSTSWHTIQNVKANDLVLISVNLIEGGSCFSTVFSPLLVQVGYRGGTNLYDEPVPVSGTHYYQFIANTTGNYLLKLGTTSSAFNYTVKSSHLIANQTSVPPESTPPPGITLPTREAASAPIAIGAGIAAISTTLAIGLAAAKLTGNGGSASVAGSANISDMPHSELQKFLNFLVGEEQEEKWRTREKRNFFSSKRGQLTAVAVSVSIMTLIFSDVEANGVPRILDPNVLEIIVPSTFMSSVAVKIASILTDTLCAQSCGVEKRYALWPIGIITFVLTGLFALFPFGAPGITKTHTQDLPLKENALLTISKTLLLLTIAVPFAILAFLGFDLIADAGLLSALTIVFFSLVPINPLPGKSVASYKKGLTVVMLLSMGFLLYGFLLKFLPPLTYVIVGVLSAVIGSFTLYRLRKGARAKMPTYAFPPPPPPPP